MSWYVFPLLPQVVIVHTHTVLISSKIQKVLMNLQLYMVDSINYLVDFHHKKSYKASTEPGAGKFDMAVFDPDFTAAEAQASEVMSSGRSLRDLGGAPPIVQEDDVVSPFIFMDLACRLILELAGG